MILCCICHEAFGCPFWECLVLGLMDSLTAFNFNSGSQSLAVSFLAFAGFALPVLDFFSIVMICSLGGQSWGSRPWGSWSHHHGWRRSSQSWNASQSWSWCCGWHGGHWSLQSWNAPRSHIVGSTDLGDQSLGTLHIVGGTGQEVKSLDQPCCPCLAGSSHHLLPPSNCKATDLTFFGCW